MTTRDWIGQQRKEVWTGNEINTISSALNLPFLRRDQSIHASPFSGSNVHGWVSISKQSCNSTFMLFESFYKHSLIASSGTGWASDIILISKVEWMEWQRSNVTCSRSRWQWVIKFWPILITISVEHLLQVLTLNNFFWKIPNHHRIWEVIFSIEL